MAEQIIHQLDNKDQPKPIKTEVTNNPKKWSGILITVIVVILALTLGRFTAQLTARSDQNLPQVTYTQDAGSGGKTFGQKNTKLCPDQAEGTIKVGGVDGEGTHHLVRKGGKDQYVYLTSSTVDLSLVENKKVQVWGKTYAATTAGWLMDVCYLEIK